MSSGANHRNGSVGEIAGTQKPAGLQIAQAMGVARLEQERAIEIVCLFGQLVARHGIEAVLLDEAEEIARSLGAHALAVQRQHRARPLGIGLRHHRQIE